MGALTDLAGMGAFGDAAKKWADGPKRSGGLSNIGTGGPDSTGNPIDDYAKQRGLGGFSGFGANRETDGGMATRLGRRFGKQR